MSKPDICETPRKAMLRAMAAARKLGYFAKHEFKFDGDIAKNAVCDRELEQFVYSLKYRPTSLVQRDFVIFYWAGEGQTLVDLFRSQGLKVEWEGGVLNSIRVYNEFPA
jgi:hypothetical protein